MPRLLLSVSGGVDSMTLWHLVRATGLPHEVLHVNFGLRGAASDGDEALVRTVAGRHGVAAHLRRVRLDASTGVQAAARAARMDATEALLAGRDLRRVCLGHHGDDQAETVLMRLSRGTGGVGLAGMRAEAGVWLRPLLDVSRDRIEAYAKTHHVRYREDVSNATDAYARNRFRHAVLPALRAADPRAVVGIRNSATLQADLVAFARQQARQVLAQARLPPRPGGAVAYDRRHLAAVDGLATLLHCWLSDAGYRGAQLLTLAAWIRDEQRARRRMDNAARTEACIVSGGRVWRTLPTSG